MHTATLTAALVVLASAMAPPVACAQEDSVVLVHRFKLPAGLAWGRITVNLAPSQWRVGSADGPAASEAQLRAALGALNGISIGARCAGWVEGATSYPCGIAVASVDLAGTVRERFASISADWQPSPGASSRRLPGTDTPAFRASGLLAPVLDTPRFVSVAMASPFLGDKSVAFGARFEFQIRAVSNPLVPSQFERDSGTVTLRGGRTTKGGADAAALPLNPYKPRQQEGSIS